MNRLSRRCLLVLWLLLLLAGCGANDDDDNDASPAADDDALDDDASVDDADTLDDDILDDDILDDDTSDDDTSDDDTIDDDSDDDDATPYWEDGVDFGPVSMDEYRLVADQGLSSWEMTAGLTAKDALLTSQSVHWVAALDVESGLYYLWHRAGEMIFERTIGEDGLEIAIVEQVGDDPFPNQDPMFAAGYDAELALYENPLGVQLPDLGYAADDPRVGWIPLDHYSYPDALERIAQIFDSPHGPDLAFGVFPWQMGGGGSHGNLGVLQSRATLLLAGAGGAPGLLEQSARLSDIAPTALALLGVDPVEGVDRRGHRVTSNLLTWQGGRVLTEALTDPSVQGLADNVVVILFDGLNPNELYHHYESPDGLDLPNFFELIENGAFYRGGAIVGWPSYSFPGHSTIGTGADYGHHGLCTNNVYLRDDGDTLSVTWLTDRLENILADPAAEMEYVMQFFHDERGVETLFGATHRTFGDWDLAHPGTWGDAYVGSVNEPTVMDADYSAFALLELVAPLWPAPTDGSPFDALADLSVPLQFVAMMNDPTHRPPKLVYASFFGTDGEGETTGPHSDALRETLQQMDDYLGAILQSYRHQGLYERTAFLIVSDHGMELQQPDTKDPWLPKLDAAGLRYTATGGTGILFLHVLRLSSSVDTFTGGEETTFTVTAINDDTLAPQAGVALTLPGGTCQPCTPQTDDAGQADFTVTPTTGETMHLSAVHDAYCPAALALTVVAPERN